MIREIKSSDCSSISAIHISTLKGDFLPSLGYNFLRSFYEGIIIQNGIYGFSFEEKGQIRGFVIGTKNFNEFFYSAIRANFIKLSFFLFLQILKNPKIIKNIMETFLYPNKDIGPKAELLVIAIEDRFQGKGIGEKLIQALEKTFKQNKIKNYKLTVHADKKATGFYQHLKFREISRFKLYNKMWFIFTKEI